MPLRRTTHHKHAPTLLLLATAATVGAQAPRPSAPLGPRIPLAAIPHRVHVALAGSPDWMAIGFGSIWVVNYAPNRVSRVDPATGGVVAEIPLGGKACLGIGVTADRVWVPTCGHVALEEIDPATNRRVARHATPVMVTVEGSFAIADGSFWIPMSGPDSSATRLARVDPHTGMVQRVIATASGSEAAVAGLGAVWVASSGTNTVLELDPARDRIVARVPVGGAPKFMTVGAGALWVQNRRDGSVSRVDSATVREVARVDAHAPTPYGDIAFGDSAVWLAVDSTLVTRIAVRTNAIDYQVMAGHGADAVRIGFGALWLADHEHGQLWRLDLAALRRTAERSRHGHAPPGAR